MALFNQLLKLHKGNMPLEDFFTEIIAHFLSENKDILFSWFKRSHILDLEDYLGSDITTQKTYKQPNTGNEKRPDIVIELSDGENYDLIFVESKVGSSEGYHQLPDYVQILDSLPGYRHKLLIYITRDFEPKEESYVFQLVPHSDVDFKQLRWHQFYQFLTTQRNSDLQKAIMAFMQEHRMAQSNQFSSVDVLALTNFPSTLKLMESVLWGKVLHRFEDIFGDHQKLGIRKRLALQNIQWHGRYVLESWMPDKWLCFMGFSMNLVDSSGYPTVRLVLQVNPKSPKRQEIIQEFRKISSDSNWNPYNLEQPNTWSSIALEKSLRDFISLDDHVFAIEEFLLDALQQLEDIKKQYPQLPWGTVPSTEIESEEELQDE
jgi:hypothetical protein